MRYVLAPEGSSGDGSGSLGAAEAEEQQGKTASILPPQGRGSGCQCRGPAQRARSAKRTWRSAQAREGKSFGACSCGILTVAGAGKNALNGARAAAAGHLDVVHVLLHGAEGACMSVCVSVCVGNAEECPDEEKERLLFSFSVPLNLWPHYSARSIGALKRMTVFLFKHKASPVGAKGGPWSWLLCFLLLVSSFPSPFSFSLFSLFSLVRFRLSSSQTLFFTHTHTHTYTPVLS